MKINLLIAFLVLTLIAVLFSGCSYIKIVSPQENQAVNMPLEIVVAHTGCGTAVGNSLRAHIDTADISASFTYYTNHAQWKAIQYQLPLGSHTLFVSADVNPGGWCFSGSDSDSREFKIASNCPIESYCAYFATRPKIANATINILEQETLNYFWEYIIELEATGAIVIAEPEESRICQEPTPCINIQLTPVEAKRILATKSAHAVWLDKNRKVPWQLNDYSENDLKGLFAKESLFNETNRFYSVVDYSPSDVYRYVLEHRLIGADIMSTFYRVLTDLRTTDIKIGFFHGSESYGDPLETAYTLYDALTVCSPRGNEVGCVRIARMGCQSMSRIIIGLLRSMNIPGEDFLRGEWNNLSAMWPAVQQTLPHADDIYTADLRATPNEEFLTPFSFYEESTNIAVCGTDKYVLSRRHRALLAIRYPAQWVKERCCNPANFDFASCEAYLQEQYGPYLTAEELATAVTTISNLCP